MPQHPADDQPGVFNITDDELEQAIHDVAAERDEEFQQSSIVQYLNQQRQHDDPTAAPLTETEAIQTIETMLFGDTLENITGNSNDAPRPYPPTEE